MDYIEYEPSGVLRPVKTRLKHETARLIVWSAEGRDECLERYVQLSESFEVDPYRRIDGALRAHLAHRMNDALDGQGCLLSLLSLLGERGMHLSQVSYFIAMTESLRDALCFAEDTLCIADRFNEVLV